MNRTKTVPLFPRYSCRHGYAVGIKCFIGLKILFYLFFLCLGGRRKGKMKIYDSKYG